MLQSFGQLQLTLQQFSRASSFTQRRVIGVAFAYDHHFEIAGFRLL